MKGDALPQIVFVCTHNAGRSQMAAALMTRNAHGKVVVRSAGTQPGEVIDPTVVSAMSEVGIDLSEESPKRLTNEMLQAADVVVTMGCGDACPIVPGKRYLDWDLSDPSGQDLATVRSIREEIDSRVAALLQELTAGS